MAPAEQVQLFKVKYSHQKKWHTEPVGEVHKFVGPGPTAHHCSILPAWGPLLCPGRQVILITVQCRACSPPDMEVQHSEKVPES